MATENIVKNQYYRILKDKANDVWDRISYWTHADDVELSNGTTLSSDLSAKDTKISNLFTDFAPVEATSTASQPYKKGQCLIYNNQFYRVIAAIATGNTLTVGSNIQVMSASELSTMLTASNGNEFYFDVKDGTHGFYPTAAKTSSTFVPFGGTAQVAVGTFSFSTTNRTTINLGFKPKQLFIRATDSTQKAYTMNMYDERYSTTKRMAGGTSSYLNWANLAPTTTSNLYSIDDNGFTVNAGNSSATIGYYFAVGDI